VQALTLEEQQLPQRLFALVRKELVRPDRAQFPGDDAFRFRHLLIRDAAYAGLPKSARAELHERFADWLEERGADLVELDEILGNHLEQAARYKAELERPDTQLAERASERLAAAGRRALWREDGRAATSLLERSLELTRPVRFDLHLELDLAEAVSVTDPRVAAGIADAAVEGARRVGDETGAALARVVAAFNRAQFAADPAVDELEALARVALPLLKQAGDHAGLFHVWDALGRVANFRGRYDDWAYAAEQATEHGRLVGRHSASLSGLGPALLQGSTPADEALRRFDAALPETLHPFLSLDRACLLATLTRFSEAASIAREASGRSRELTGDDAGELELAHIVTLEGDHEAAVRYLRTAYERFERQDRRASLAGIAPQLGRELCALGRFDEAERLALVGRELGDESDVWAQAIWRQVQARVEAHRGEHVEAERLAREAVAIIDPTDCLNFQGEAFCDLAEVLHAAGRTDEAAAALEQALESYERKKNLAMVAQVRPRLEELRAAVQ
jgi:tetratricopeptide (TPR) repeat protein